MLSPKSKQGNRPLPYLRNANVQWERFDLADVATMDFSEAEEVKFALQPGDLLVCEGGDPGRAAVWQGEIPRCCYQKALHRLRPLQGSADPQFLLYRLWLGRFTREFTDRNAKTTIAHLPAVRLAGLRIELPPLPEQRRIAARLREQLAAVAEASAAIRAQCEAAKDLARVQLRTAYTNDASPAWPKRKLGDLLRLRKEVVHPRDNPSGPAVFVGLEHVESVTGKRIGSLPVEMSQLTGRKPRFYAGDIVYGYLRPYLNKLWIAEFDGLCSVDQYVYEVNKEQADTSFIAWFMRSPVYLERAPIDATPGQLPRIRTDEVASVELALPPIREQRAVVARIQEELAETTALQDALSARRNAFDHLPSALLREAFAGRL